MWVLINYTVTYSKDKVSNHALVVFFTQDTWKTTSVRKKSLPIDILLCTGLGNLEGAASTFVEDA